MMNFSKPHSFLLIKCLYVLFLAFVVNCESYYTINAPGVIKSNRKYSVVAALHEADGPCSVRVRIGGPNFNEFEDVNLQPFEFKIMEFWPKKLQEGVFSLKAEGLTGFNFKNESRVREILNEGPKIYIQTDKAIYKPQDLVKFRFVLLDEHTRPLNITDPIRVKIRDAKDNLVKHLKNVTLIHGIYTGKFRLSKYPSLGSWVIEVVIDGNYNYSGFKRIKIYNYSLPKFSVHLRSQTNIVLKDASKIKVKIYGRYTFGKYVEGNATIALWADIEGILLQTEHIDIQSLGFVDFNLKDIKDIDKYTRLAVRASLSEKNTAKTEMEEKTINIRSQHYNLLVPDNEIEFENNEPYSIKAYVKYWTGAPVLDRKTPVTMKHGNKTYETFLDRTGAATFEFDYDENSNYEFQYKDSKTTFPSIYSHKNLMLNNREYYCRLKLVDKKLELGKPVVIEVSSIVNIPYLMYTVMGHASLVRTGHIKVPPKQKSYTIEITPSIEMIPKSFIYVYYVHKGNLRYEEMTLEFPDEFENQISLSAPQQAKPGENVTITIHAQPNSYVGIMAVDLGVYLLDHTYDLDKYQIIRDLRYEQSYSVIASAEYPGIISGLITLTNAHYPFRLLPGPEFVSPYVPPRYRFREKFPETWIFDNYWITDNETKLTLQVPDAITTWRITAFSNNAVTGFGIVNGPTDITTIQTFFISLSLPYAVKRGEIVAILVSIFNYSNQTQDTEVTLQNSEKEFYFMESKRQDVHESSDEQQQTKQISIAANKGKVVKFLIFPLKAGEIDLRITATSESYSDAVRQKLKVEPEGVSKVQNQAKYLSIPRGEKISSTFKVEDAVDIVPDSEYVTFSVGGHYLVPTVENFGDLTEIPTSNGEQNMVKFAPSVLILQYLKVNRKLMKEKDLVESLKSAIEVSYQEQLAFRHNNGGYSVFGMEDDEEADTWLTAYVVRYFIKASEFLDIESNIIEEDLEYLAAQQQSNGGFLLTEYISDPKHENEYGLTAFILLAFLEDPTYANKYRKTIENGVEFLNQNLNNVKDINALSLIAAVIKRVKHPGADILVDQLKSHGKENNGLRWWSANDQNPASDVELTANAALTLLDTPGDHAGILKWLIKQRNANGGFISSYDTVAGMEALVKFSEKFTDIKNVNLRLSYSAMDEMGNELATDEITVEPDNVLSLQKRELPRGTRQVKYEMEGNGAALVQVSQQYNVDNVHEFQHFKIEPKLIMQNQDEYVLKFCFTYLPNEGGDAESSNVVISEINLPSGFRSGLQESYTLKKNILIKKFEIKNSDSLVVLYLNKLAANEKYCSQMPLQKIHEVLMPRPAAIIMYDYYNISRSNTKFYSL